LNALGDFGDARALAERALAQASAPPMRAQILSFLAGLAWFSGAATDADGLLQRALAEADDDARGALYAKLTRFNFSRDVERAVHYADEALRILRDDREPALVAHVLVDRFVGGAMLGLGADSELLPRALALEQGSFPHLPEGPQPMVLIWHHCVDEIEAARARHALEEAWYRDRGEEVWVADRLSHLALAELHAGRWDVAEQQVEASSAAIEALDARGPVAMVFEKRALVDAYRGRTERARATLLPLLDSFAAAGQRWWEALTLSTLAVVEFAAGDDRAADATVRRMHDAAREVGVVEILFDRSEPFHVESLLALGDVEGARAALARLERRHAVLPRAWTAAALPRTRALVRAAEGDLAGGLTLLEHSDGSETRRLPFEDACTLLVTGRLNRRAKQKRVAADALRGALAIFEELGARSWIERTQVELDRVGLRHRPPTDLTTTELKIAELAASRLTNRQVAQAAFMSPKTVEANLARVYRKLGIHSRAELGARLALEARDAGAQT
jgi:DNA-binding CsgD family transcriptional regulator